MSTRYVYETTIRVEVVMADEGEISEIDGLPTHWETEIAQEESAREYVEEAAPLIVSCDTDDCVKVDAPALRLVAKEELPRTTKQRWGVGR